MPAALLGRRLWRVSLSWVPEVFQVSFTPHSPLCCWTPDECGPLSEALPPPTVPKNSARMLGRKP